MTTLSDVLRRLDALSGDSSDYEVRLTASWVRLELRELLYVTCARCGAQVERAAATSACDVDETTSDSDPLCPACVAEMSPCPPTLRVVPTSGDEEVPW